MNDNTLCESRPLDAMQGRAHVAFADADGASCLLSRHGGPSLVAA